MYDGRIRARISRKSTHSIMCNTGFGDLKIKKYGIEIVVPKDLITRDGHPKQFVKELLKGNALTKDVIVKLEEKGCKILVA